jgi:hypothetical protein
MDTPSQQIVKSANATAKVEFGEGRSVTIRKLLPIDRMRVAEMVGADNAKNDLYLAYASFAFHVTELDGNPIARPTTKIALEAIVQRLGDDGLTAVGQGIGDNFSPKSQTEEEVADEIKN